MVAVFSVKKLAKSSAVKEEAGGGGGRGQRRELNVLKSVCLLEVLLILCSQRTSDNQGSEGVAHAGLEKRGQMLSRVEVKVDFKVSVSVFTSREEKCEGEVREDDTADERWGDIKRRFRQKVTGRRVGGAQVAS